MKDTIIKGNGKSRVLRAPIDMPDTFAAWRSQLLSGTAYMDISLNTSTDESAGVDLVGTALSKQTLLTDSVANNLNLSEDNATVNNAFAAVYSKFPAITLTVRSNLATTIRVAKGNYSFTKTPSNYSATFTLPETGTWAIYGTVGSNTRQTSVNIPSFGEYTTYTTSTLNYLPWKNIQQDRLGEGRLGETKTIYIGGIPYPVRLVNVDALSYTFLLDTGLNTKNVFNQTATRQGGWEKSYLRNTVIPNIYAQLDEDLKSVILPSNVTTYTYDGTSTSPVNTTDKLYIPSEYELFGSTTYGIGQEGTRFQWFANGNTLVRQTAGEASAWWTRSGVQSQTTSNCVVSFAGSIATRETNNECGVVFAFRV